MVRKQLVYIGKTITMARIWFTAEHHYVHEDYMQKTRILSLGEFSGVIISMDARGDREEGSRWKIAWRNFNDGLVDDFYTYGEKHISQPHLLEERG